MRMEKRFEVKSSRDVVVAVFDEDATLPALFSGMATEIVAKQGDRKTIVSHYNALGREGDITFHFDFLMDGGVRFEKVCDGNIWRELRGEMSVEGLGQDRAEIRIEMHGRTKALVPEFTIKGPMQEQIEQMVSALRERIEAAG